MDERRLEWRKVGWGGGEEAWVEERRLEWSRAMAEWRRGGWMDQRRLGGGKEPGMKAGRLDGEEEAGVE